MGSRKIYLFLLFLSTQGKKGFCNVKGGLIPSYCPVQYRTRMITMAITARTVNDPLICRYIFFFLLISLLIVNPSVFLDHSCRDPCFGRFLRARHEPPQPYSIVNFLL